jgi:hypothetical protein
MAALVLVLLGTESTQAAGFPVYVTTTNITGQEGKVLVFSAQPEAGEMKVACAQIDAAVFDTPNLLLKEAGQGANPCDTGLPDAFILPGQMTITAGVYVGGSQTPERQVSTTVNVQDESTWQLDGVALTADTAGDSDCDRETDSVDALQVLRNVAGIGAPAACLDAGNLKCDDGITSVDSLMILRHVAQLAVNLPGGCPSPFTAPELLSPAEGEVVHSETRDIPLDWDDVAGAPQYSVQVDCESCCAGGQYCSDVGRGYRFATVADSEYTVHVAGDNLERWRAWAVNEDGTPGDFSEWRTFDVDSSPPMAH